MRNRLQAAWIITLGLIPFSFTPTAALAQTKKPALKPPVKVAPSNGPVVLGTNQLPGDFGQFGQTYTIGKHSPLNFTLVSAEYMVGRYSAGSETIVPSEGQKLLVLHYTVHNPTPEPQDFDWGSIHFTVVDRKDVNHENKSLVVRDGTTETVSVTLKPAQKLNVQTVIVVPADGVIPKLIVQRDSESAVVRYDLRGKVKPLPAPFADTEDTAGATVRKLVPAQVGTFYPLGAYDVRLDSVTYTTTPVGDGEGAETPGEGKRYAIINVTVRNAATAEYDYQWGTFAPELKDADGEKYPYNNQVLKATRNESASGTLKPGEEIRLRYYYTISTEATAKTFSLAGSVGSDPTHTLVFDVSSLPKQ